MIAGEPRRVLITVSGSISPDIGKEVADGVRPRPDYLVLAELLDADLLDHTAAQAQEGFIGHVIERIAGPHGVLAWACFRRRRRYDAILTDGEQVGLPLALLWGFLPRGSTAHVMIGHVLSVPKKRLLFRWFRLARRIDAIVVYSSWQQRWLVGELGFPTARVLRSPFMVDTDFFQVGAARPTTSDEPTVVTAGLERRDYPTLITAARGLAANVVIAAASPWSRRADSTGGQQLPPNVEVRSLSFEPLRQLYADASFVVMPLFDVDFQAGVTTILEAMAMGKPVVCTRTRGQTDIVADGITGLYVPAGDPEALRTAIEELLGDPDRVRTMGTAARRFVEEHADVERYAQELADRVLVAIDLRR